MKHDTQALLSKYGLDLEDLSTTEKQHKYWSLVFSNSSRFAIILLTEYGHLSFSLIFFFVVLMYDYSSQRPPRGTFFFFTFPFFFGAQEVGTS